MKITVLLAGALLCVLLQPADARTRHPPSLTGRVDIGCSDPVMRPCHVDFSYRQVGRKNRHAIPPGLSRVLAEGAGRIVSHPSGCPRRAFCGCGAAVRIFGKPIRSLWLAANWFRFPRSAPAPGTVAVRRHHVFVLERHMVGSTWLVFDANSGKHRTRVHPRSIVGYVIVDPRAGA